MANDRTMPLAPPVNAELAAPVAASTDAMFALYCPPTLVNFPPR